VGTILGGAAFSYALPPYRAYDVRIRSTGEGLLAYDSGARRIGLYPGTVARLDWHASPVTIRFGRLVDPEGHPVPGASITGQGVWSQTDDNGYFQIEAADDVELTATTRDGRIYAVTLPTGARGEDIAQVGNVECCGDPEIRLGSLDRSAGGGNKGSK
ncbi:MAG TPA: CS1-pili formation C-terminal domain-containing protein, partial [Croceibacterium sp.]|nr:CS1-pili formation C-terminal domain-containing protein [Croceibacterium sp.]